MSKQTFTVGQVLTASQMTSLQQTAMGGGSTTAKTASYVLVAADAGTVVQMNAAGATTITVNTALFAAGDTVQIQNIGAGVCTVTAGTATVSTAGSLALSQYEGGQLYFNTTSAALFFDIVQTSGMTNPMTTTGDIIYSSSGSTPAALAIGTTGQILTVAAGLPSWATAASGGMTLISTTTLTGASITLSSIPGTYKNLYIVIRNAKAVNNGVPINMRFNADSTANRHAYSDSWVSVRTFNQTSSWMTAGNDGNVTSTGLLTATIFDYTNTATWKYGLTFGIATDSTSGVDPRFFQNTMAYNQIGAITSLQFLPNSGNWTSGTVLLYGVS